MSMGTIPPASTDYDAMRYLRFFISVPSVTVIALLLTTIVPVGCSNSNEMSRRPQKSKSTSEAAHNSQSAALNRLTGGACRASRLVGFHDPESWGVWSANDPATIVLEQPINGQLRLRIVVYTFDDGSPHALKIRVGDETKTVSLIPQPKAFDLDYSLSRPSQQVILSGIAPRSPQSTDNRKLGVGLINIECEPTSGNVKQN